MLKKILLKSKHLKLKGRNGKREISHSLLRANAVILPFREVRSFIRVTPAISFALEGPSQSPDNRESKEGKEHHLALVHSMRDVVYFRPCKGCVRLFCAQSQLG